jgi:methionyl-tRNA formyltransferase
MSHFSIAFIGDGTLLRRCVHAACNFPDAEVRLVVHTRSNAEVTTDLPTYCSDNQVDLRHYSPDDAESILGLLSSIRPDYLFSIHTPILLSHAWLSTCGHPINFHPAPLPRYAGVNGPSWAILNGESRYGVTWHSMDDRFDHGDIVCQQCFDISPDWDVADLILEANDVGEALFRTLLHSAAAGHIVTEPQRLTERTYFSKTQRPYGGVLPLEASLQELDRLRRATAYYPLPNPFFAPRMTIAERTFYLVKYRLSNRRLPFAPGCLLRIGKTEIAVALTQGQLIIDKVQDLPGEAAIDAAEYALRHGLRVGQIASTGTSLVGQQDIHLEASKYP